MSNRLITLAEGVGQLFGGEVPLREVLYRLSKPVDDTGMVRPSEAVGPLEGLIDVGDMAEAVVLAGVEDLVLELDDGQRISIALTSTSGRFELRGVGPGPDALLEFARRYTEAWGSQDPARVASFFAPRGSLSVNGDAPATGRAAIAAVAQSFMAALPDLRVSLDGITNDGEWTVYQWTLAGTNTGPGGTGRPVRISGVERWRLSVDGLIDESLGSFDAADYRRQLEGA